MTIARGIRTPIMHRIVKANGFVFVGGTIADDTTLPMGGQTEQILAKIDGYLAEAGTDRTKLVSASIFVTDLSKKKEMDAAWTAWLAPENLPARATVGVADLGGGALVEIVVTALQA
jgi:2-iminobutanoate/2-iminopropanoate deaminase